MVAVAVGAVVGALHVTAAVSVWRGRSWGAGLGALIASAGLLVSGVVLRDDTWSWALPACAGYLGTLLVLAYALLAGWLRRGPV